MAATHCQPAPTSLRDLERPVTYEEASALLARTGHKASPNTIYRWVQEDGIATVRVRRKDYASWTDILDAHFKRTAAKLRASANWP